MRVDGGKADCLPFDTRAIAVATGTWPVDFDRMRWSQFKGHSREELKRCQLDGG
jgi:hypothetical protein